MQASYFETLLGARSHAKRMGEPLRDRAKQEPSGQEQRIEIFADHFGVRRRNSVDTLRTLDRLQAFRAQG